MSRKVRPLDGEAVEDLPDRCRTCLFWELGRPRPTPDSGTERLGTDDELAGDPLVSKQAWATNQVLAGRPPGRIVRVDDEIAGYALFGPSTEFASRKLPVPRASRDSVLLATLWIDPAYRERGVGRVLVQAALKEAIRLELRAVEAYGDRRWRDSDCVLPCTWLLHEGFEIAVEHPRYPLLRLETRRTARWADALEHAVEEVLDLFPRRAPAPAPNGGVGMPSPVPESRRERPATPRVLDTASRGQTRWPSNGP